MGSVASVVEFLYDFASPNCYVALHKLLELRDRSKFEMRLTPLFLGGLFQMTDDAAVAKETNEYNYMVRNLGRLSKGLGIEFNFPHSSFPMNSVRALRGSYFAGDRGKGEEYVTRVFGGAWGEGMDISSQDELGRVVQSLGLGREEFLEYIGKEETKLRLRKETDSAYARGVFGAPTYFVDGEMFWGTPEVLWLLERQGRL